MVYLLHFTDDSGHTARYKHAGHYLGWCPDNGLQSRLHEHETGHGARLTEVIHDAGMHFALARTWDGASRRDERQLKNRGGAARICPICQAERRTQ